MKNSTSRIGLSLVAFLLLTISVVNAQERIAVIQNPFIVLLDPADGSIIDPSFIDLTALNPGTPKGILQVLEEIWVTDQLEDRIDRFDLSGAYLSTINGGLDNIRGLAVVNSEVWVTNAGSNNGAPGNAIVRFDLTGNNLGFFSTSGSVFDIIDVGGEVYISYISTETKIERRDYSGTVLGNIVEEGVVNFIQQMEVNTANNSVYAAVFSVTGGNSSGLYEFAISDGAILNYWSQGNLRGTAILNNDNVLVSNGAGVSILDPTSGNFTTVTSDSSQFFGKLTLTPCTTPPTPTGDASQTFNAGATLMDIVVSPMDVTWFATEADAMSGANPLPLSTILVDNTTYYAVNIEGNCLSEPFAVTVDLILSVSEFSLDALSVYPNPVSNILNIEHSNTIKNIKISNILGQEVLFQAVNDKTISLDISQLASTMYIVTVDFGGIQHSIRIVKSE